MIASLDGAVRLQEKRKPSHLDFCINNRAFLIRTRQHIQPHAQDWSHCTTNNIRDKQFQLYNSLVASNLAEIHKQHKHVLKCGDRKTLTLTVYRVKHKKHHTNVHEKEPLVKQLTAGHTDVIYVNGIDLRSRLKPPTPIKSETNDSLLSDKQEKLLLLVSFGIQFSRTF